MTRPTRPGRNHSLHRGTARLCGLAALLAAGAQAQVAPDPHGGHALGRVDFSVSCSAAAQAPFEYAVALLHHMTYPQARASFGALAQREPGCAMAHWGIAMTLFQPLWPTRPSEADLVLGAAEVSAARAAAPASERERLFIDAAAAFFDNDGSPSYWDRIRRWEAAMQRLHAAYPDDPEATAFYALAHLAVAPPDARARVNADRAAALLLPVYRDNPDHPGAMHYLVHANDIPGREHELLEIVRRYETVAPDNPHALHMPTHIYTRLGDWPAVIRGNLRAADAALSYPAGDQGQYVWDEFPHAIEYLVYAYLQQGADDQAKAQIDRLRAHDNLEPSFKTAFHLASVPARHALERRDWSAAATLPVRQPASLAWDRFPWPEAVTWFARGLGAAHGQDIDAARAAEARLAQLEARAAEAGESLFERSIRALGLAVGAWRAQSEGDPALAHKLMTEAADLEAATPKHPVTPGPTLPAHELLGDLLMAQGRPDHALSAYEQALRLYPERFNSLLGLTRAAAANGDLARARESGAHLLAITRDGPRRRALEAWSETHLSQPDNADAVEP